MNADYNNLKQHQDLLDDIQATYIQKNKAYGDSFHETYKDLGIISAVTRMSDKWNRIKNLAKCRVNKENIDIGDESLRDTLMDLANYCVMTVMELDREQYDNENIGKEQCHGEECNQT